MNRIIIKMAFPAFMLALFAAACAPKIYQPPHLGAEYRFDEGLKPEKPKQQLFSKSMHRYLRKTGVEQPSSKTAASSAANAQKDTAKTARTPQGSVSKDTLTTPAPASLTASPDSSHSVPH